MKNELFQIAKDLEQGKITDQEARTLLLSLLGFSKCPNCDTGVKEPASFQCSDNCGYFEG